MAPTSHYQYEGRNRLAGQIVRAETPSKTRVSTYGYGVTQLKSPMFPIARASLLGLLAFLTHVSLVKPIRAWMLPPKGQQLGMCQTRENPTIAAILLFSLNTTPKRVSSNNTPQFLPGFLCPHQHTNNHVVLTPFHIQSSNPGMPFSFL